MSTRHSSEPMITCRVCNRRFMSYALGIGECISHVRKMHNGVGMEMLIDNRCKAKKIAIDMARRIYVPDPDDTMLVSDH